MSSLLIGGAVAFGLLFILGVIVVITNRTAKREGFYHKNRISLGA